MDKQEWLQQAENIIKGYLTRQDGCFDDQMHATLLACDYEAQSVTIEFETQKWQINEWGGIHGGAMSLALSIAASNAFATVPASVPAAILAGQGWMSGRRQFISGMLAAAAGAVSALLAYELAAAL